MKTLNAFQLSSLCIAHFPASLLDVRFGSTMVPSEGPDSSEVIEPLQRYLFSCNPETDLLTDPSSVIGCMDLLAKFVGTALESEYVAWGYDKEKILKTLSDGC